MRRVANLPTLENRPAPKCKKLKTNPKGKDFAFVFIWYRSTLPLGTYKFTWKKGGHKIDEDAMSLHSEGV